MAPRVWCLLSPAEWQARADALDEAARLVQAEYDDIENACEHGCHERLEALARRIRALRGAAQLKLGGGT